jgi:hypothetical protein
VRFSEYFKLDRTQPYLDFVDIPLHTDVAVFVDPSAIKTSESTFGHECASLVQGYFESVLQRIRSGRHTDAMQLVSSLNERNEFHLGFSRKKSRGHAFGEKSAKAVWGALSKSRASISGLLQDLEDTCLLIEGIGKDMVSDAVCNIIRGPLIRYTQDMCEYYGVPLTPEIESGPVWNPDQEKWEQSLVSLPMTKHHGKVVLVPKVLVRHRLSYRFDEYYRHYLMPEMQQDEIDARTSLVELLKDGTPRVTKKKLYKKYGAGKLAVVEQTIKRPHVLEEYRKDKGKRAPPPLEHEGLAEIEGTAIPNWDKLLAELAAVHVGTDDASAYENVIERILTAVFYPSLCHPKKQHSIHNGRKRIDLTYMNDARDGFFKWLASHYPSAYVMVECKNYGKEIGNPEVDQLSSRFSPGRGQFGILVCRSVQDRKTLTARCRDTAQDQRGYMLVLDDADIRTLVTAARDRRELHQFTLLRDRFRELTS